MNSDIAKERTSKEERAEELRCNATGTHEDVVMESIGVTESDCPNYVEEDDVRDSIAEGYF